MTEIPRPPPNWRPLRMILPLDLIAELDADWTNSELRAFVRARIAAGDPGPLLLDEGGATTPFWDLEIERSNLLDLLRWRANLP